METLITPQWLRAHLNDEDLVVLDCSVKTLEDAQGRIRNVSARVDYEAAHIPTAGFADLTEDLSDLASRYEFALPTPHDFCNAMGALGVDDDSKVVLYDNTMSAWAARVWWMLRWVGFDNAAILDGGLRAWIEAGHETVSSPGSGPAALPAPRPRERQAGHLTPKPRPELIATADDVQAAIGDTNTILIDALPNAFYRGEHTMYARPGHIPTAINIGGPGLLDPETGRYRPHNQLAAIHADLDTEKRTITYCGGGILASSNAFVLNRLGFENVAVYTNSLQEWAADEKRPMSTSLD